MSDIIHKIPNNSSFNLSINDEQDYPYIANLGNALSSVDRIRILKLLSDRPMSVSEISEKLNNNSVSSKYEEYKVAVGDYLDTPVSYIANVCEVSEENKSVDGGMI